MKHEGGSTCFRRTVERCCASPAWPRWLQRMGTIDVHSRCAGKDPDRLCDFQDRSLCRRRRHHHPAQLRAVGEGRRMRPAASSSATRSCRSRSSSTTTARSSEEAVKAIERLANQDKVDFILPPWSTGLNLAVGPTLNRLGYPHLAVTSVTDKAPELAKRWSNATFWLGTSAQISEALADLLGKLKSEGKIGAQRRDGQHRRPVRHRALRGRAAKPSRSTASRSPTTRPIRWDRRISSRC